MRVYFAGCDKHREGHALLQAEGGRYRLLSYLYLRGGTPYPNYEHLLIDSGGFSARFLGTEIPVEEYALWLDEQGIEHAFNLDTNDLAETLANQDYLERNCRAYILPIYHMSDYDAERELLDQFLADGYPLIGVGGIAMVKGLTPERKSNFYNYVFSRTRDQVAVHGLGILGIDDMLTYPWFSADSTTWLASTRYGKSPALYNTGMNMAVPFLKPAKRTVMRMDIRRFLDIEKDASALWAERGVVWEGIPHQRPEGRPQGPVSDAL